jgi:ribose 5-phosphate isomerase B
MRVALGADHAAFDLKEHLKRVLDEMHVPYEDFGCASPEPVDYPDIAAAVGSSVAGSGAERGILACGTGIGMAIAANKIHGVRAAPCYSVETVALARGHNDLNVLALGARVTTADTAAALVRAFLETPFDGGRHQRRVEKIAAIENGDGRPQDPTSPNLQSLREEPS